MTTEVDGVEVVLKNLILGGHRLKLECQQRLVNLSTPGALLGQEGVLRVLLGDGGSTLGRPAGEVVDDRAHKSNWRDSAMVVEVSVLSRKDRLLDLVGDIAQGNASARGITEPPDLIGAICVIDDGGLAGGQLIRRGNRGHRKGNGEGTDAQQEQGNTGDQDASTPMRPLGLLPSSGRRASTGGSGGWTSARTPLISGHLFPSSSMRSRGVRGARRGTPSPKTKVFIKKFQWQRWHTSTT